MRYMVYGNSGGIDRVKNFLDSDELENGEMKKFDTLYEAIAHIYEKYKKCIIAEDGISDVKVVWYCIDDRLYCKDVFMIVGDVEGYRDQFLSYLIEL